MIEIRKTDAFDAWLDGLRDRGARNRIVQRLSRLERGLAGDIQPVGKGVSELRFHFGPGYRVYFLRRGQALIILLGGGDKSTQTNDIKAALALASEIEE